MLPARSFLSPDHGTGEIKEAINREILSALEEAKIGTAWAAYGIIGVPPLRLHSETASQRA